MLRSLPARPVARPRERGGVTILLALILLIVMGAAALGLNRNTLRELAMVGNLVQGEKAGAVADAGLDWVIIWGQGAWMKEPDFASAHATGNQAALVATLKTAVRTGQTTPWTLAADATMTMAGKSGTTTTAQSFDLSIQPLGALTGQGTAASSNNNEASGNTDPNSGFLRSTQWLITSVGKANNNGVVFQASREYTATIPSF